MGRIFDRLSAWRLYWLLGFGAVLCGSVSAEPFNGYPEAVRINREVNASHQYTPRIAKWHRPWRAIERGEPGNCLDYAVLKCAELRKADFSADRLSLIAFTRWDGQGHALCVIDGKWGMDWKSIPVLATKEALSAQTDLVPVEGVNAKWR